METGRAIEDTEAGPAPEVKPSEDANAKPAEPAGAEEKPAEVKTAKPKRRPNRPMTPKIQP